MNEERRRVRVDGVVQGLVIGDHNPAIQHFHPSDPPRAVPREAPPVPVHFSGRDLLLDRVLETLCTDPVTPRVAVCGMDGVGVSTLAAVVARAPRIETVFSDGCFWIDLRGGDVMDALQRMARAFGESVSDLETPASRCRAVRSLLAEKRVLTVLDDPRGETDLELFEPANGASAILMTTRDRDLADATCDEVLTIPPLEANAAVTLLGAITGHGDAADLAELAADLGGLPLALELAGRQARKESRRPGFSWEGFAARLSAGRARLDLGRADHTIRAAFAETWETALDEIGRRHFAILGLFPPGELTTGEIAASWKAEPPVALAGLEELVDLSLLLPTSPATVRLHPLLRDYAEERAAELSADEVTSAHGRISDHHGSRSVAEPQTWADILPALRAHHHAWFARDRERASRVFPWCGDVGVPGFLIDRGRRDTLVRHYAMDLDLADKENRTVAAWAEYRLGDALASVGDLDRAADHLGRALAVVQTSGEGSGTAARDAAKFSYRLGQVRTGLGDHDGAIAAYQTALASDEQHGQTDAALVTMLQIGDLHLARGDRRGQREARRIYERTGEIAREQTYPAEQTIALVRLAELDLTADPDAALAAVQKALALDDASGRVPAPDGRSARVVQSAFTGRQGVRYATRLGCIAQQLAVAGRPALTAAITAFRIAIRRAETEERWAEQAEALFWLGNLCEHLFLIGERPPELGAAWACYALSERRIQGLESPPAINPGQRLADRVLPRIPAETRLALASRIADDPLGVIEEVVTRLLTGAAAAGA